MKPGATEHEESNKVQGDKLEHKEQGTNLEDLDELEVLPQEDGGTKIHGDKID